MRVRWWSVAMQRSYGEAGGGATRERKSVHTEKDEEGLGRKKMEAGLY